MCTTKSGGIPILFPSLIDYSKDKLWEKLELSILSS